MRTSRFSEAQIVGILQEPEAGAGTTALCRRHGICEQTLYRWKRTYGGLHVSEARRLKTLDEENARLKRLVAEQALDNQALREVLRKNWCRPPSGGRRWAIFGSGLPSPSAMPVGWSGLAGRRYGTRHGAMSTRGRSNTACTNWRGTDPALGIGGCTSCCGGKGSSSTTSELNGSIGRMDWRSAAAAASAWRAGSADDPPPRSDRITSGPSTS